MAWVYILECSDATLYVGSTTDIVARIHQHENGRGASYTRRRLPVRLIWLGAFERVEEAFAFEKKIQGWSRAKKLALMEAGSRECSAALSSRGSDPRGHTCRRLICRRSRWGDSHSGRFATAVDGLRGDRTAPPGR